MKGYCFYMALLGSVILLSSFVCFRSCAVESVHHTKGEITVIHLEHKALSIEVSLTEGMFTVSGPFSPDAVLKKAGVHTSISDFGVGEGGI